MCISFELMHAIRRVQEIFRHQHSMAHRDFRFRALNCGIVTLRVFLRYNYWGLQPTLTTCGAGEDLQRSRRQANERRRDPSLQGHPYLNGSVARLYVRTTLSLVRHSMISSCLMIYTVRSPSAETYHTRTQQLAAFLSQLPLLIYYILSSASLHCCTADLIATAISLLPSSFRNTPGIPERLFNLSGCQLGSSRSIRYLLRATSLAFDAAPNSSFSFRAAVRSRFCSSDCLPSA